MKLWRKILGIILNLSALFCTTFGIAQHFVAKQMEGFAELVQLPLAFGLFIWLVAAIGVAGDAILLAKKKAPKFPAAMRLMGAVAGVTLLVFAFVYLFLFAEPKVELAEILSLDVNIWLLVLAPALVLLAFLIMNKPRMKWAYAFLGMIPAAIYCGVVILLAQFNLIPALPYAFLSYADQPIWQFCAYVGGAVVGGFIIALILLLIHNIFSKEEAAPAEEPEAVEAEEAPIAEEPEPEEEAAPAEEPEPEEEPEEETPILVSEPEPEVVPEPVSVPERRIHTVTARHRTAYFITRSATGQWQVKLAGATDPVRVFDSQAEAVAFTKGLVESRGGSYRIHALSGKIHG